MSPVDLYFIVLSAVIAGGLLTAIAVASIVRYSRAEDAGAKPHFYDLALTLLAFAFVIFGMWRAGLFG